MQPLALPEYGGYRGGHGGGHRGGEDIRQGMGEDRVGDPQTLGGPERKPQIINNATFLLTLFLNHFRSSMPQVATSPASDKGNLDCAFEKQKRASKAKERQSTSARQPTPAYPTAPRVTANAR